MIEVTDEMLALLREYQMGAYGELDDDCDKRMIAALIELHEANKPKPEPVGYIYKHQLEQMLNSTIDNDCNFFPIKDDISRVIFNSKRDKYLALYVEPLTREPLSEVEINDIIEDVLPHGTMLNLVREIEQAHGIGVTND